ncbi:hypothetical protein C9994_15570, partial [Marivirga lumbricoides]
RQSISIDERNPYVYRNLGILALKKGDYTEAIRQLKEALKKNEHLSSANFYLGEAYRLNSQKELACEYYQTSTSLGEKQGVKAYEKFCQEIAM